MGNYNPIGINKRQKLDPKAGPTTITKVRCSKCNTKRILEQEKECPKGCLSKAKKKTRKKAAIKKAASAPETPEAPTE